MGKFTPRVELHGATEPDYEVLHEAMKKRGFSRTILDEDGIEHHLPTAEYNLIGDYKKSQVCKLAKEAAEVTRKPAAVLVTKGSRRWSGLKAVAK